MWFWLIVVSQSSENNYSEIIESLESHECDDWWMTPGQIAVCTTQFVLNVVAMLGVQVHYWSSAPVSAQASDDRTRAVLGTSDAFMVLHHPSLTAELEVVDVTAVCDTSWSGETYLRKFQRSHHMINDKRAFLVDANISHCNLLAAFTNGLKSDNQRSLKSKNDKQSTTLPCNAVFGLSALQH